MCEIQQSLCDMKKQKPVFFTDRNTLRAALVDYLPSNKLQQNLLLNAYDFDIVKVWSNSSDKTLAALNSISQMENDFGVQKDSVIWANVFFKTHAWLTVKKGQRLEVGGKVTLSAYGGIA